jgi:acyl-CoA synthetase (NDP forming)/RimJ/RimL family protein N-acetyltransferase
MAESPARGLLDPPRALDAFFHPRRIAVLGGGPVLTNLHAGGFPGVITETLEENTDLALLTAPDPGPALRVCAGRRIPAVVYAHTEVEPIPGCLFLGPYSFGLMRPWQRLNATLAPELARPGPVAFVTQSAAIGAAMLDWSQRSGTGFSAFLSSGSMRGVSWGQIIQRLGDDTHTRSILLYLETIGDARRYLSAAREVALSKPILLLKPGRGSDEDEAVEAALRRCGVLRVERISDLYFISEILGKQPAPPGPRLAIVSTAHGPATLAADALLRWGGQLAAKTLVAPEAIGPAVQAALATDAADGVLAIVTPHSSEPPEAIARALIRVPKHSGKPLLASFLGGVEAGRGVVLLDQAGIPTLPYPDTAARAFTYMVRYATILRGLYETPHLITVETPAIEVTGDSRALLEAHGFTFAEAPPPDATPLRLESHHDPTFGPVLRLGASGRLRDFVPGTASALPPLNSTLARRFLERTPVWPAIAPCTAPLERALVAFSGIVASQPRLGELRLDPLWVTPDVVSIGQATLALLPDGQTARLAIRPYPAQYTTTFRMKNGLAATLRPIRPEDEPMIVAFHQGLSERTVYFRYFQVLNLSQRTSHERLTRICFIDYDREIALVAVHEDSILAVGRLTRLHDSDDAEFAVLVADAWQGQGLGAELLRRLLDVARAEGIRVVAGQVLPENRSMLAIARKAGFRLRDLPGEGVVEVSVNVANLPT